MSAQDAGNRARSSSTTRASTSASTASSARRSGAPAREWDRDTVRRIKWLKGLSLPDDKPFRLNTHATVTEPARFLEALRRDVEKGPEGPRARYGAIQQDLQNLEKYCKENGLA